MVNEGALMKIWTCSMERCDREQSTHDSTPDAAKILTEAGWRLDPLVCPFCLKESETKTAVAAYDMFQSAMKLLIARADTTAAQNYVEFKMVGLPAPFDRAAIILIREHGMTPQETAAHNKTIALQALETIADVARTIQDRSHFESLEGSKSLTEYVRAQRGKLL